MQRCHCDSMQRRPWFLCASILKVLVSVGSEVVFHRYWHFIALKSILHLLLFKSHRVIHIEILSPTLFYSISDAQHTIFLMCIFFSSPFVFVRCCSIAWIGECVSFLWVSAAVSPFTWTIAHAFRLYIYSLIRFMHRHNFIMCTLYSIYFYMQNRLPRFSRFSRLLARFVYHHCSDSSSIDRMGAFV